MEALTIFLFCGVLLLCLILDGPIVWALLIGLAIFLAYGLLRGFSLASLLRSAAEGVFSARNVLLTFFLIGIMTGLWRLSGTVSEIVCCASSLMRPAFVLPASFLLCCLVSVLTGTAFGTAATMGVICAAMASAMGLSLIPVGGAVLAGCFFGDRCSPVSTSALLVSELTGTNLFSNIRAMLRTALLPFLLSLVFYLILGFFLPAEDTDMDLGSLFSAAFRLEYTALIPALLILVLACCRVPVKKAMFFSILSAVPVCLFVQGAEWRELWSAAVTGYACPVEELSPMINGGGIVSMLRSAVIICISSAYSGIFRLTGLLNRIQQRIRGLDRVLTPYGAMLLTSVPAGMLACNQTLAIMLTYQLCADGQSSEETALYLENSAVLTAPLVPWSIACSVPLGSVGAPVPAAGLAVFLYLLPLCELCHALWRKRRENKEK